MNFKLSISFLLFFFVISFTNSASAATIAVNTLTDENNTNGAACSLREAINNANNDNTASGLGCVAGSGTDDIVFAVSGTINLTAVLPDISSSMNIGNNTTTAPNLTVNRSSGGAYRIFLVAGGTTVSMSGIVVTNGNTTGFGGGIYNTGTLTLNNCVISNNNTTNEGTGVFNQDALTVSNSSFLNNSSTAYGGGLSHRFGSLLNISNSTFSGNSASVGGGAIDIADPNATITNTTFTNNSAGFGGAMTISANSTLNNCTITGNSATSFNSGGFYAYNNSTINLTNSTVARNSTSGLGVESGTTLTLRNTIVAGNTASNGTTPLDISGTVSASSQNNLIGTGGAGGLTNGVNGNQTNIAFANVGLLPLGNYGGSVQTMPIRTNSPARNAGTNTGAPATDARGFSRPQATITDIGAFEIQTNSIVTNVVDSGAGSLRDVVAAVPAGEIVQFDSPFFDTARTVSLTGGQITLNKNLTIYGNGANILNVQNTQAASSTSRVFNISAGFTVNLSGMTISGGNVSGSGNGGGLNNLGILSLDAVHITGNQTDGFGGGIYNSPGRTLNISNSTVSNNSAGGGTTAGGIDNDRGLLFTVTNTTISGNSSINASAPSNSGGLWINSLSGTAVITNSTITNNSAVGTTDIGGGIHKASGSVTFRNTIIAGNQNNSTIPDIAVSGGNTITSGGFNLVGNRGTITGFNQPTDITGTSPLFENVGDKSLAPSAVVDPSLLPLALNGGTVPTHSPRGNSLVIDKGNAFGSTVDARGLARPVDLAGFANAAGGDGADIGAFEFQLAPTAASVSVSGRVLTASGAGLTNTLVYLTASNGTTRTVKTTSFGYYQFDELQTGETYTISIVSRKLQFAPQILTVNESVAGLDFTAFE